MEYPNQKQNQKKKYLHWWTHAFIVKNSYLMVSHLYNCDLYGNISIAISTCEKNNMFFASKQNQTEKVRKSNKNQFDF